MVISEVTIPITVIFCYSMGDSTFHFFAIGELPVGDFSHSPGPNNGSYHLSQSALSSPLVHREFCSVSPASLPVRAKGILC